MKIYSKFLSLILCTTLFGFSSCSGDDDAGTDDDVTGACNDFQGEWEDVVTSLNAYSQNPNPETCDDYKEAMIDFYQEFEDCQYWGQQYQEAIDEVQAMDCSDVSSDT
ncbi:hypothetical protein RM549_13550 [Salegentibacter sp. F188]|uniref:Lipoprotein n=1 Tax=Autumnicola patrickiae TaxID=3075591 RepID=A0ABU3E489_9FLAO|nr:hypothetical protein [Salegentibacter sp. F188]MDT0690817.1 hypothetical protein [Salegentibacter sp. F188]